MLFNDLLTDVDWDFPLDPSNINFATEFDSVLYNFHIFECCPDLGFSKEQGAYKIYGYKVTKLKNATFLDL